MYLEYILDVSGQNVSYVYYFYHNTMYENKAFCLISVQKRILQPFTRLKSYNDSAATVRTGSSLQNLLHDLCCPALQQLLLIVHSS